MTTRARDEKGTEHNPAVNYKYWCFINKDKQKLLRDGGRLSKTGGNNYFLMEIKDESKIVSFFEQQKTAQWEQRSTQTPPSWSQSSAGDSTS